MAGNFAANLSATDTTLAVAITQELDFPTVSYGAVRVLCSSNCHPNANLLKRSVSVKATDALSSSSYPTA